VLEEALKKGGRRGEGKRGERRGKGNAADDLGLKLSASCVSGQHGN
jgi:hypothetical protein